jgi:pimeloyl-ACP methyl ester carboxylesterase
MASVANHMPHGDLDDVLRGPAQQPVVWKRTWVQERPAHYGITGEGRPIVLLHGWALAHHTYRGVLQSLAAAGWRVVAPALPGFGGTPGLPGSEFSLAGYANWLAEFLREVGVDEEAVLIGHSFGGGVAIRTAHDHPELVRSLVLVNSIGGSSWRRGEVMTSIADRPLWDWGLHFPADVWPVRQATRVLPVILEDAIPNLLRNPRSVVRVANLARRADLRGELEELNDRGLPVTIIWSSRDGIIPRESFEAMCTAAGTTGREVEGSHSWLLADPGRFVEVITNDLTVAAQAQRRARRPLRRFRRLR